MIENRPLLVYFTHGVLILGLIVISFPIYIAFVASTHAVEDLIATVQPWFGGELIENYLTVLRSGKQTAGGVPVSTMMVNSLVMALGITVGKIAISIISAYAIVFFRFRFRMFFFWIIFLTLMLPVEVRILPTYKVVADLGLLNSYAGLTLPLIASATATFLFRQIFLTIPDELVEAAKIDGAGPVRFFFDILLPLSRTNIAALTIILFIYGWNQYLWPLLMTTDAQFTTVVIGISRMLNSGEARPVWDQIMGMTLLAMLPPILVVLSMQKLFVKGLTEQEK